MLTDRLNPKLESACQRAARSTAQYGGVFDASSHQTRQSGWRELVRRMMPSRVGGNLTLMVTSVVNERSGRLILWLFLVVCNGESKWRSLADVDRSALCASS